YFASSPTCASTLNESEIITVLALPSATISGNATICSGSTSNVSFNGTANATVTYTINGSANQTVTLDGTGNASVTTAALTANATYNLVSITSAGAPACTQTITGSITITVLPLPTATISGNATICSGTNTSISFNGTPNAMIAYSINGGANQTILLDGTGNASVNSGTLTATTVYALLGITLTSSPFCNAVLNNSITITVENAPVISFTPNTTFGCAPLLVTFTNTTSNANNCVWNFGDGGTANGCGIVNHTYTTAGCYDVTLTSESANGCVSSLTMPNLICVEAMPIASFEPTPAVISVSHPISTMINNSSNAVSYNWNFGDGSNSTLINPEHTFNINETENYTITLIASSQSGCKDTAKVTITVEEELIYYIPNTFTPDGDKFNQTFQPVFSMGIDPFHFNMLIFNRWGEIIFESNDAKIGWDGTYGGKIVEDGVYTWKINFKLKTNDDHKMIVGHVNVLR
ncbi:MAG: gliding motility-associated C-terminal domain-containing protein, partial [Flavobacteriia bacterium]|nr:gliding motility-associated C-terminal domain-containing protein [Flavobacteriia bacterium]